LLLVFFFLNSDKSIDANESLICRNSSFNQAINIRQRALARRSTHA